MPPMAYASGPFIIIIRNGLWRRCAALVPVAALVASAIALDPAAQLERHFQVELAATATHTRFEPSSTPVAVAPVRLVGPTATSSLRSAAKTADTAATETEWLKTLPEAGNVARVGWSAPVRPGDRILIVGGPDDGRVLDVLSVEVDAEPQVTRIDTRQQAGDGVDTFVALCRDSADPAQKLVRVTLDRDARGMRLVGSVEREL